MIADNREVSCLLWGETGDYAICILNLQKEEESRIENTMNRLFMLWEFVEFK